MNITWSRWAPLDRRSQDRPGVYRVRLQASHGPVTIPRFLGPDTDGILAIGKATSLESRRAKIVRALRVGRGHSELNLMWRILQHRTIADAYGNTEIEFQFAPLPSVDEAEEVEDHLLKVYLLRHGEVPPLNSAIPDRYAGDSWDAAALAALRPAVQDRAAGA